MLPVASGDATRTAHVSNSIRRYNKLQGWSTFARYGAQTLNCALMYELHANMELYVEWMAWACELFTIIDIYDVLMIRIALASDAPTS